MSDSRRIGGFRVLNELASGTGSQGSVVRAVCEEDCLPGVGIGDIVALKLMRAPEDDGKSWERLERRTQKLAAINHPNIVKYYGCFSEIGSFSSSYVVVMEFLEGETLKERLGASSDDLDADQAMAIVGGALAGMVAAERAGIVHRDIKPGNIFICRDGKVKLIDFEISRTTTTESLSSTGRFAGTFDYMAPEFADEAFRGDSRSDVFSMGVVFHETLTGVTPYTHSKQKGAQADFEFLSRWSQRKEGLCAVHIKSTIRRVLSHADEVLSRALAEKREDRFATAAEFFEAMKAIRFRELRNGANAYRLLKAIGRGGFGEVFKARLKSTGEYVAVKHLLKSAYGDRFRREARVMKQLDDPAFVRFVDYFEMDRAGGVEAFLVMAFLPGMPGSSLRDAIKRHKTSLLDPRAVFQAFVLYAQALATMHRQGIYHRDIKPSNLYYPEQSPDKSAIMDLGIARDVNGTATAGQVPGTLDYMPPEVVLGGSRGDAGMDIYALGLCFYEAISGQMAYPRLPTGPDAFQAFFDRARLGQAPSFEADEVKRIPGLLDLLRDMTAIDPALRLHDASQLHRRMIALAAGVAARPAPVATPSPAQTVITAPVSPPAPSPRRRAAKGRTPADAPKRRVAENLTNATMQTGREHPLPEPQVSPARRPSRGMHKMALGAILAFVILGVALLLSMNSLKDLYGRWQADNERKKLEEIQAEAQARQDAVRAAERQRVEALARAAETSADDVVRRVRTENLSQLAAGNLVDEWKLKWKDQPDVAETYRSTSDRLNAELKAKKVRDSERAMAERKKAEQIAAELRRKKEADAALKRRRAEEKIAQEARNEVLQREIREAEKLSVEQASALCARFADEKESPQAVDADRAVWETNWERFRNENFYIKAAREMDEARTDRTLLESGRTVATECDHWLENIDSVTAENVRNWRTYIDRAENVLRLAVGEKRISTKAASAVEARIDACRHWVVGVIDNKTHEQLDFCGTKIAGVSSRVVIFRQGLPEGAALTCVGYEPIRVREDRFESQAFLVLPRDLKESRGTTKARLGRLPDGVVCFIDGVETSPGEVSLRRGRHHAVYRNTKETYGGIRDYNDQDVPFITDDDHVVEIDGPSGKWTQSAEFLAHEKNAGLVARGERIVSLVKTNLRPEPVESRRDRLQKVYAVINDWRTSEALAVLGGRVERELRTLYEEERKRIRGVVSNRTSLAAIVETDHGKVTIPAGKSIMVTFESRWTGEEHVSLTGYEFVMLPRVPSDFEKKTFVIRQEKLVPLPVQITLPECEKDVACLVDGKQVRVAFELRPGQYEGVYTRPDYLKQAFTFTVEVGRPLRLPAPRKWEPSGAFTSFTEALSSFNDGALDKAKKLTEKIGAIEDPERRQELEDLKKAIELRRRIKGGGGVN